MIRVLLSLLPAVYALAFAPEAPAQIDSLLAPVSSPSAPAFAKTNAAAIPGDSATPAATLSPASAVAAVPTSAQTRHLTAERLAAELEKELGAHLALPGDLKLTLARPWQPVELPADHLVVAITELPPGGISGTFFIKAKITSGDAVIVDGQLPLRAQLWQEVWVAASRLDRGQALDRTVLAPQKIDVLRERQPLLSTETDPTTLEAVLGVAAGRPVTKRDVTVRPLIRKGQVVEAVAQQGALAISMKALALEAGAAGDPIKLRNLDSRKEFSGQILNENRVQVHF